MSRTDVHAPWWVKERDPEWRSFFADEHDHRGSGCTLAEWLTSRSTVGDCYRGYLWRGRNIGCGCDLCTGRTERRRERRRQRHQARHELKRWVDD